MDKKILRVTLKKGKGSWSQIKKTTAKLRDSFKSTLKSLRKGIREAIWPFVLVGLAPIVFLKRQWMRVNVRGNVLEPTRKLAKRAKNFAIQAFWVLWDSSNALEEALDLVVSKADVELQELITTIRAVSSELRLSSEGVIQRLPIRAIKWNGDIVSEEGRTFAFIDLAGFSAADIYSMIGELYRLGPTAPFKIVWEGAIVGSAIAEHVDWLLGQVEENRVKYKEFSPKATLPFDDWLRMYLEVAQGIRRNHRMIQPYLVVQKSALADSLSFLKERQIRPIELSLYFLGMLDHLSEWDDRSFRESQDKVPYTGYIDALTPDKIEYYQDAVLTKNRGAWPNEDGEQELRKTYRDSFTIVGPPYSNELRELLLPLIVDEDRRFYLESTFQPVPVEAKSPFYSYAQKEMRKVTGYNSVKNQVAAAEIKGYGHDEATTFAFKKAGIPESRNRYRREVEEAEDHFRSRPPFRASPLTLIIKTTTLEDLRDFRKQVETVLRDGDIWFEKPGDWPDQERALHRVLPVISESEIKDEVLTVPTWDTFIANNLVFGQIPVLRDGIVCGVIGEEGTPLSVGLSIIEAQGKPSSGKSMAAKVLAAFVRLANPERRVIVIDNSVASTAASKTKEQAITESQQMGWIEWCKLMGGSVVYAEDFKTPHELVEALEAVENERFILYYPGRASKQHDLAALQWVIGALWRFHQPDKYSEREIEQMLVNDDILSWNNDRDTPDNPGHRFNYLTQDVLNQCFSTGTLVISTFQTARAVELGDPASHEVLSTNTDVWLNFETSAYADVPGAIGMRPFIPEQENLILRTASGLASISTRGTGNGNPGACWVTIHNVEGEPGQIWVHPEMLRILSRKIVK